MARHASSVWWMFSVPSLFSLIGVGLWVANGRAVADSASAQSPPVPEGNAASTPVPFPVAQEFEIFDNPDSHRQERREVAERFLEGDCADPDRQALARRGVDLNHRLLLHFPDVKDVEKYIVRPGDSLTRILRKFARLEGCTGSLLMLNALSESSVLVPGRSLRVSLGRWSILVDKSLFTLYLCYEDAPFKEYRVAIGAGGKTPTAEFTVNGKNPKPMWWPPRTLGIRAPVNYGDPRNPLGEWWIGLDHPRREGFGIHGTNDPDSIGTASSLGCVRMRNEEIGEIAGFAFRGMTVRIVD